MILQDIWVALFRRGLIAKGVLVLSAPFFISLANAAASTTETYKDIIDKALHLSVQKDRVQAIQILAKSISKESKKSPPPKDLVLALEDVAAVFYSDKAQQLFELAISLRMNSPSIALQRLSEALQLEPDNLQVELEQIRLQLILNECSKAESLVASLQQRIPAVESVQLIATQVALCQGHFEKAAQLRGAIETKKSPMAIFWYSTEADQALRSSQPQKALELATLMLKVEPRFSESHYWLWKAETELKKTSEKSAQNYLNSCKGLSARHFREYLAEPTMCRRVAEVEASLKKSDQTK